MVLPESIGRFVADSTYSIDTVGMSDSEVLCFENMVLKIEKRSIQTEAEAAMMKWLQGRIPVPELLVHENVGDKSFLLMSRISGKMLCDEEIVTDAHRVVALAAEALQMFWNVDITDAPALITLEEKLQLAEMRVAAGLCDTEDAEPDTYGPNGFISPEKLLQWLIENKPEERLVLSHGDFCLPNIFVKDGKVNGFIDLGRCGVSDRYQDIALCWRSLKHNYDGRYGMRLDDFDPDVLFDVLGVKPDRELLRYYILLDELF